MHAPKHDVVRVEGLKVDCVVGLYPHERNASQPLEVDLALHLDTSAAAREENVRQTIDYAATSAQLVFLLRSCRFRLLETAAETLARYLLAPASEGEQRAQPTAVDITLRKPDALRAFATPSLSISRQGAPALGKETKEWGTVDIIHETKDAGIYRLNIAPGKGIPLHIHRVMRESEMVLTSGVECQLQPVPMGTVHRWPRGAAHRYDNPSDRWQSILCVDIPRFIPEDEIEVEGEPADVPPEPPWGPIAGIG
ncbi:MAG: dihydroneopterin aldolase [Myxococcota bacterium]